MKKKQFLITDRFNFSDADLIARPHGMIDPNEPLIEEIRNLRKALLRKDKKSIDNKLLTNESSFQNLTVPINKRYIKTELKELRSSLKLGKKEKKLLDILSDLKKHPTQAIQHEVPTTAHRKLKQTLNKKLKETNFSINKTVTNNGIYSQPSYQLEYLTQLNLTN